MPSNPKNTTFLKEDYNFTLPPEFIAVSPAVPRDHSKMMNLNGDAIGHHHFYDFCDLIPKNSLIILNDTKVLPARLKGNRLSGGKLELLLVTELELGLWECKVKNSAKIKLEEKISLAEGKMSATLMKKLESGLCIIQFDDGNNLTVPRKIWTATVTPLHYQ